MKTREKILPKCIVKRIKPGDEDKEVSFSVVAATAMYVVFVVWLFFMKPFGEENLWIETCLAICVLAILIALGYIFVARASLLERKRLRAIKAYAKAKRNEKEAKTEEARIKVQEWIASLENELKELHVPLDCEAIKKRQKELERSNAN